MFHIYLGFFTVEREAIVTCGNRECSNIPLIQGNGLRGLSLVPSEDNLVMKGLTWGCAFGRSLGRLHLLCPMLGRQKPGVTIRMVITVRNQESFFFAIVILNGDSHGALPYMVDTCSTIAFNHFVSWKKVSDKVFPDVGNTCSASVVNSKIHAVSVKFCLGLDAIMYWISMCR